MSHSKNALQSAAVAGSTVVNVATPKPSVHKIYSAYDRPKHKVSLSFAGEGRTKQYFKDDTDINNIMRKFQKTGTVEFTNRNAARYGDVIGADFNDAMLVVARGKSMFQELPSSLRARFDNDPAKFMDFMHDPDTVDEQRELGLRLPKADEGTPPKEAPVRATGGAAAASEQHSHRDPATGQYVEDPVKGSKAN